MLTPDELRRLSTLLEEALALLVAERPAWLERLEGDAAALKPLLRNMLARAGEETADGPLRDFAFTAVGAAVTTSSFAAGDPVGTYRLLRPLGQGGMGEVWVAERIDGLLTRAVALKLPLLGARREMLAQRFRREREILGTLAHPHIARLYDAGVSAAGQPFLALELVDGRHITDFCRDDKLDARARVRLVRQVVDAVQYAHANLVIHRDLKPSNVLVDAEGQTKLLDFGIAKLLEDAETDALETELTQLGGRALTLGYAAPEQITGGAINTATDVWALGVLLYELLSGERPFQGDRRSVEEAILTRDAGRPAGVSDDLLTIVAKAMKRDPAERYPTANALGEDLDRWLAGKPVTARRDSFWYRMRKFVSRHRLATATGVGVVATVLTATVVSIRQAQVAREQTRVATEEVQISAAVQDFLQNLFQNNSVDQDPAEARAKTATQLLDEGAARLGNALDDQPKAKLRILGILVNLYSRMGEDAKEIAIAEQQLRLAETAFPGASSERAQALAVLANQLFYNGRQSDGKARLLEARRLVKLNPGMDFDGRLLVQMAVVELDRATGYADPRGLEEAERLVSLFQGRPPSGEEVRALFLKGSREISQGRNSEAIASLRAALELEQKLPGGVQQGVADIQLGIAEAQGAAGDLAGSEASRLAALRLAEPAGRSSNKVMLQKMKLARFLASNGRPREALPLLVDVESSLPALARDRARQAYMAVPLAYSMVSTLRLMGLPEQALDKGASLRLLQSSAIDDPNDMIWSLSAEARALIDVGRWDDAEARLTEAERVRSANGVGNRNTLNELLLAQIALALARGDVGRATDLRESLAIKAPSASTLDAIEADILWARQQPAIAEAMAARALAALAARPPDTGAPLHRFRLELVLARALIAQGRPAEAIAPLVHALDWNARACDASMSPDRVTALVALAQARSALGDAGAASAALAEARAIRGRHPSLGPQYPTMDSIR